MSSAERLLFNEMEDKKLVEMISKFPCIYDVCSKWINKDLNGRDMAWREIAEELGRSEEHCKRRWKNIKDAWQKKQKREKSTPAVIKGKNDWKLADSLTFLNKVGKRWERSSKVQTGESRSQEEAIIKRSASNIQSGNSHSHEGPINRGSSPTPSTQENQSQNHPKRLGRRTRQTERILELLEKRRNEREVIFKRITDEKLHEDGDDDDDDVDLFFKSVARSVKKLRPDLINKAKMRCLQMVVDVENRNSCNLDDLSKTRSNTHIIQMSHYPEGDSESMSTNCVDNTTSTELDNAILPTTIKCESV